jgi:hypothetical protein
MKRIRQTQQGGQIRSDVERLSELKIWINGRELPVDLAVGPRSTKWFGVLPSDVKSDSIKKTIIDAFSSAEAQKLGIIKRRNDGHGCEDYDACQPSSSRRLLLAPGLAFPEAQPSTTHRRATRLRA